MANLNVNVPEISEWFRNKTFGPSDIKWVKTVNDDTASGACMHGDSRVFEMPDGLFFCMEFNKFIKGFTDSMSLVKAGDLILLYQKLNDAANNQKVKCFTHLAAFIDDTVVPNPYGRKWPGRWVKAIAMTGSGIENSIRFEDTKWPVIGFENETHRLLKHPNGNISEINLNRQLSDEKLTELQNDIWNRFSCFLK